MICNVCKIGTSVVNVFEKHGNQTREIGLCEKCAMENFGLSPEGSTSDIVDKLETLFGGILGGSDARVHKSDKIKFKNSKVLDYADTFTNSHEGVCIGCQKSKEDFLRDHKYNCPACQDTFMDFEDPLEKQMREAVASENFEKAAQLRDKIKKRNNVKT